MNFAEMDSETTCSKQKIERDDVYTFENNTKQKLSTWQQQKILLLRALICIKRDSVSKRSKRWLIHN